MLSSLVGSAVTLMQHPSNQYTFGVHQRNGSYSCFRCNASGNWYDLKKAISGVAYEVMSVMSFLLGCFIVSPACPSHSRCVVAGNFAKRVDRV